MSVYVWPFGTAFLTGARAVVLIPNFACPPLAGEAKFARRAAAKNPDGVLNRLAGYPGFFSCTFLCDGKILDTSLIRPDSRRIWPSDPSLSCFAGRARGGFFY